MFISTATQMICPETIKISPDLVKNCIFIFCFRPLSAYIQLDWTTRNWKKKLQVCSFYEVFVFGWTCKIALKQESFAKFTVYNIGLKCAATCIICVYMYIDVAWACLLWWLTGWRCVYSTVFVSFLLVSLSFVSGIDPLALLFLFI
jgi:hypothetical protein